MNSAFKLINKINDKTEDSEMVKKNIISFPHLGNYHVVIHSLLKRIAGNCEILSPKKMTKITMELGEKHSPDFVCTPFKYTLGNFIESLESGSNILIQGGGGCRFGYYAETQEQILKDLGYNFTLISLSEAKGVNAPKLYKKFKEINQNLNFFYFTHHFLLTMKMIRFLDDSEKYIRENISYEVSKGEFEQLHKNLLKELKMVKTSKDFIIIKNTYDKLLKSIKLDKSYKALKVGIVGELYVVIEPFSNFFLEKELAKMGIETRRYITVTYLLSEKDKEEKKLIKSANKYIKHALGADGTASVAHSKELCEEGFDGIIHVKPFGCTPETNAMPMLQKISRDYNVPIMYFTFDMLTSETGIKTRLEAFYDMLKMKKEAQGV